MSCMVAVRRAMDSRSVAEIMKKKIGFPLRRETKFYIVVT